MLDVVKSHPSIRAFSLSVKGIGTLVILFLQ